MLNKLPARDAKRWPERALGAQIHELRLKKNLSLAELARNASLSPSTLSRIENGRMSPSLATLQILASALDVALTALFVRLEEGHECTFIPAGDGPMEESAVGPGRHHRSLGRRAQGPIRVAPRLLRLAPGAAVPAAASPAAIEFVYLLSGEMVYRHAGADYRLKPGDALLFDAGAPNGPVSIERPTDYISVVAELATDPVSPDTPAPGH